MMWLVKKKKWGGMESVEEGWLSIPAVWIFVTFLIWGSWAQSLPGLIKEIFLV